ncbi:MAG: bacterio-opsin activator domain-containing protein, partial [Halobacteriales archaeon]|nr:bacterio-opsin activator domain-containing protein [Halobacteriales archaeon]
DRAPTVRGARPLRSDDGDQLWELVVRGASPLIELIEHGGALDTVTVSDGEARITAHFPPDINTRTVVEAVRSSFTGTELVSQREVDRTAASARGLHADISEALTDRQSAVLNAAYHAGYLDQPRGSTGEELAEALGITASTFHQHFRAAERKLIEAYIGDDSRRRGDPTPK